MTEALASILRPEDLYPRRSRTGYRIHWPFDSSPSALTGRTLSLNGARILVLDVIEDFGGISAEGQSVILVADRLQ